MFFQSVAATHFLAPHISPFKGFKKKPYTCHWKLRYCHIRFSTTVRELHQQRCCSWKEVDRYDSGTSLISLYDCWLNCHRITSSLPLYFTPTSLKIAYLSLYECHHLILNWCLYRSQTLDNFVSRLTDL